MKKFYTLLSVALAGTMMVSAATRVTEVKNANLEAKQVNDLKTFSTEKVEVVKKAQAYKAPAKAEAVATDDLNGEYIFKAYARNFDATTNGLPSAYWMNESVPYIEIAEDNSVYIENFWFDNVLTGVYDPAAGTITIDRTQTFPVNTQSGPVETCVYVLNMQTMAPADLVLKVDAEKRLLSWTPADNGQQYLETLLFGAPTYNGTQIFDQMFDCALNMINCVGYSWVTDNNGEFILGQDGQPVSYPYYSYATVDHAAGTVSIDNFLDFDGSSFAEEGSFGYPIVFNIDKDAQTATAKDQNIPLQFTATEWVPFNLYGIELVDEDFDTTEEFMMMGDEQALENGTIVTAFQNTGVGAALFGTFQNETYGQEFYMVEYIIFDAVFTGNDDAGIADVVVDNNENAPVEYFNLQGVRVENPAAGLYIRRQGNKSTKVLVK